MRFIKQVVLATLVMLMYGLSSCNQYLDDQPTEVLEALNKAGHNRGELEKVLRHYANDSLKLEAARYLIANMPGHYGYDGAALDSVEVVLAEMGQFDINFVLTDSMRERLRYPFFLLPRNDDIRSIKGDNLIETIDDAFRHWRERPWNRNLRFEEFCELLLPYNIADERWTYWRKVYNSYYQPRLDSLYQGDDVVEAAKVLHRLVSESPMYYNDELITPHRDALALFDSKIGFNRDIVDRLLYAMRACGIPVAIDLMIVAPFNGTSHQWLVVYDIDNDTYIPFGYDGISPERGKVQWDHRKKGKVYRICYAGQPEHVASTASIRSLPVKLNNPFLRDVTSEYFGENEVQIPVHTDHKDVFLALQGPITNKARIIDTGICNDSMVTFRNIEAGVYYLPVIEHRSRFKVCGDPFFIEPDGEVTILKADKNRPEKVTLSRVMSMSQIARLRLADKVIGGVIEGSMYPDFKERDTLHIFKDTLNTNFVVIPLPAAKDYKYLRFVHNNPTTSLSFAELQAYSDMELKNQVPLRLIDDVPARFKPETPIDGDFGTCYTAPNDINVATFRVLDNVPLSALLFSPNNDNYFVLRGNEYELMYLDGHEGWISLGTKKSKGPTITFDAPANSLLVLRNKTKKMPAAAFIVRDGKQLFPVDFGLIINSDRSEP